MLMRGPSFTRFLHDGRVCLSTKRALRGIALGRKSWLFAGSDRGGRRAAAMYSLIVTAKMNDIDPQAWLADVLASPSYLARMRTGYTSSQSACSPRTAARTAGRQVGWNRRLSLLRIVGRATSVQV